MFFVWQNPEDRKKEDGEADDDEDDDNDDLDEDTLVSNRTSFFISNLAENSLVYIHTETNA